jgi:hypothetical protein
MLEFLQNQHARASGDDEAVAADVVGAACVVGEVSLYFELIAPMASNRFDIVQSRSSWPPAKDHVLLAPLDQLAGVADAVRRGRAGRRDRVVDAVDLEPGGKRRRCGRGHCLGHRERADPLRLPFLRVMSAASISVRVDGPPEPITMPVRSW